LSKRSQQAPSSALHPHQCRRDPGRLQSLARFLSIIAPIERPQADAVNHPTGLLALTDPRLQAHEREPGAHLLSLLDRAEGASLNEIL
jgi:hypothetical protein